MCTVKIEKILSVSSEDPAFPAENLLKTEVGKSIKWKCKNAGDLNAVVILQLAEAVTFSSIDIGNCGSAFIEILVGKSCLPDAEYKVLLITTMLMTMQESKDEINCNSVRFFKPENMNQPEISDKWDRVKIVCSQPFNKHIQYGLSFVKFYSPLPSSSSPVVGHLGRFLLKEEKLDDITPGSLFARRKELNNDDPEMEKKGSVASSIRAANLNLSITSETSVTENKVKKRENTVKKEMRKNYSDEPTPKKPRNAQTKATNNSLSEKKTPLRRNSSEKPVPKKEKPRLTKPFEKLMEGVVFVISGFQNPLRSDIRSKGLALGAKYRADWDRNCSHLICAFPNTPKFNQVRGQGKIVKKEWIEDSYSRKIRFPWRRYALDQRDFNSPESEDEIYEQVNEPSSSSAVRTDNMSDDDDDDNNVSSGPALFPHLNKTPMQRGKQTNQESAGKPSKMDIDDDSERLTKQRPKALKASSPKLTFKGQSKMDTDDSSPSKIHRNEGESEPLGSVSNQSKANGNDDGDSTQSDSEWASEVDRDCYPLPYLPEQFNGLSVFVSDEYSEETKNKLKRYIIAHSGTVHASFNPDVEFVITDKSESIAEWKKEYPLIAGIKSEWVWRCHDENRLLPISKFEI